MLMFVLEFEQRISPIFNGNKIMTYTTVRSKSETARGVVKALLQLNNNL